MVPYNLERSTFLHYFTNFFTTLLSSSVCYFTFQVRFNPQFKQLFARTKFRFSVWASGGGHEMAARSQLLLEVFTTNVNTIFENFQHSDPAPPSSAWHGWVWRDEAIFTQKHNSNICMFVSDWAKINTKGLMWHATHSIQCSMMGNVLTQHYETVL